MLEKGNAIMPIAELNFGERNTSAQDQNDCGNKPALGPGQSLHDRLNSNSQGQKNPNGRKITVTVGHGLRTPLNQADRGQQSDQKPEPTHDEPRTGLTPAPDHDGNTD